MDQILGTIFETFVFASARTQPEQKMSRAIVEEPLETVYSIRGKTGGKLCIGARI